MVQKHQPCDWSETCAAEGLFGAKPKLQIGPYLAEIAKPFRLMAARREQDLIITIDLSGFSKLWSAEVKWALLFALRQYVNWRDLAKDKALFVPKRILLEEPVKMVLEAPIYNHLGGSVVLTFKTPVDSERGSLIEFPHLLFERLFLRIALLARWHDVRLEEDWTSLKKYWDGLEFNISNVERPTEQRIGGHKYRNRLNTPQELEIIGLNEKLLSFLRLGELSGVGRGAIIGLGTYVIWPAE